jgi:GntR family transcriptional repressor for pyruvate dehydrogenase complex
VAGPGENVPVFKRVVREPRLSDKVARDILEAIVETPLRPGERLAPERVLCDQFDVSRTVIREALRSLAGKGVIEITQGRGVRIARVEPSSVRESMGLFLRGRPALDYGQVHEIRALLETEVAGLAAERATPDDLAALAGACDELAAEVGETERAAEADFAFHRLLARATHNEMFLVLLDAIDAPLMEIRIETFESIPERPAVALQAHSDIYREICNGNVLGARQTMHDHLDDVLLAWRRMTAGLGGGGDAGDGPDPTGRVRPVRRKRVARRRQNRTRRVCHE